MNPSKKFKIGVFGSAEGNFENILERTTQLGNELAKQNITVVTGACNGLPYLVAEAASKKGVKIWEFSHRRNKAEQLKATPQADLSIYQKIIFIPKSFEFSNIEEVCRKYRNVTSIANCDAGIVISGRWGTLNEFTNLYDMEKVIGVLTETGGIADELVRLTKKIHKPNKAKIIFSPSPKELVKKVITELKKANNLDTGKIIKD